MLQGACYHFALLLLDEVDGLLLLIISSGRMINNIKTTVTSQTLRF